MDSRDLQQYLWRNDIAAEIVVLREETPTVASAATAVGVQPNQIVKSVLFMADGRPLLVVTNGLSHIHRKRLADAAGFSRRKVRIADALQVQQYTGYPVGAVPPFGHPQPLPTLVDSGVLAEPELYGGGGAVNALLRLHPDVLLAATGATIVDIADR